MGQGEVRSIHWSRHTVTRAFLYSSLSSILGEIRALRELESSGEEGERMNEANFQEVFGGK